MKTQKDAIYEIVKEVLGDLYSPERDMRPYFGSMGKNGLKIYPEDYNSSELMDKAVELLKKKVKSGEIAKPKPRMNKHGVVNNPNANWSPRNLIYNGLRKDKRLNGGSYEKKFEEKAIEYEVQKVTNCSNNPKIKQLLASKALNETFLLLYSNKLDYKEFLYTKSHILVQILEILEANEEDKKAS